ncbi:vitamin K epoxide reductase family protein [Flavobacterium sp. GCM10027622]|uniref:vitamin K epoxide reductase family protein n=1 Tax=unclassified Flavobacterium TaxID=196869 RepID=UPI00360C8D21
MNLVKKLLIQNKYSNSIEEFEDLFSSHPNYPSLFAITDSLNHLGIDNVAIKIPKEQFVELPYIFLTLYDNELVLLLKYEEYVTVENEKGKKQKLSFNEFLSGWSQIIVAVEPNVEENKHNAKNYKWITYVVPFLLMCSASVFLNEYSVAAILSLTVSIVGMVLGILIMQEKLGIKTELVSKFCNLTPVASCDSVIKSDNGNITRWLSFADLPILFFSTNLLALLMNPIQSAWIVSGLSLVSIPFLIYAIWIQQVKIKKWCVLCLAVSAVILLQGCVFFASNSDLMVNDLVKGITFYLFSFVFMFSGWLLLKPILEKGNKATREVHELKRFKRNFKVFQSLTKEVTSEIGLHKLKGIEFGEPNFSTNITLFVSPSCGHCHKAFKDAYELYELHPEDVYLNVLFNINPENEENPYKTIVESLLIRNTIDTQEAQEALIDWHINNLDIELWKQKWGANNNDMLVNNDLLNQYQWCTMNNFNYTPIKIVNSKLFPNEYEISDLKYFMNDFEDEFQSHYEKLAQSSV